MAKVSKTESMFTKTYRLFGFIPLFNYRDFDSHYIFNFLGFRIKKRHKTNFEYKEVTACGVTEVKREQQLIVSLTSYPARINTSAIAINTLLNQTLKPDRIILWLADSQFQNKENDLPQELLKLRDFGLEIRWCEDLRSYKKLVPALKEFPNEIIITADDDIYYSESWLESLYKEYLRNPTNVYVKRAIRLKAEKNQLVRMYRGDTAIKDNFKDASFSNQLMSGSGCLFPPHCLYKDVFDIGKIRTIVPTHDDIYFWAMAILNGTKIQVVGGFDEEILTISGSEGIALCRMNRKNSTGLSPNVARKRIVEQYPQIIEILTKEENK